jgi:hypothetical protein
MKRWAVASMLCVFVVAHGLCFAERILMAQAPCSYPHVPKKNGVLDQRKNDLWELVNDWVFFRGQILKKTADGDTKGAQKARQDFQQTNAWLSEYPESQVYEATALAEKCRSGK